MAQKPTTERDVEQLIGREYVETPTFPGEDSDEIATLYGQVAQRHEILYEQIPIPVIWTHDDPYSSAGELFERVDADGELLVFAGGSKPKYMTQEQNVKGRAAHDYFGHLRFRVDFSIEGEFLKWHNAKQFYPPETHRLLFTEIVGQRCAAGFLDGGFGSPRFTQRSFEAPENWIEAAERAFLAESHPTARTWPAAHPTVVPGTHPPDGRV